MKEIIIGILKKHNVKSMNDLEIDSMGSMDIDRVIEIYTDNYNIQNMLGNNVFKGYESLLDTLNEKKVKEVNVSIVNLDEISPIIVFTNIENNTLIGYLYPFDL
jgi:hypothetical protein